MKVVTAVRDWRRANHSTVTNRSGDIATALRATVGWYSCELKSVVVEKSVAAIIMIVSLPMVQMEL
jgi:hypothetical protein